MSKRELILADAISVLKKQRTVKLGTVQREPVIVDELAKTAFPAVTVETADETREESAVAHFTVATLELAILVTVHGANRDAHKNRVFEAIENTMIADRTRNKNAVDTRLQSIEAVELAELAPYSTARMVFAIEYHIN